jgi:mannose-6-phosphate isomerase
MSDFDAPLFFEPLPFERVWGGNHLAALFGKPFPQGKVIGESWELSDRPGAESIVAWGPCAGLTLREVLARHPEEMYGTLAHGERFPLLVKYVDAGTALSVQVHPDDAGARSFGDAGKNECWVVVRAAPGAQIVRGLKAGVTRADFERAVDAQNVEPLLHSFSPNVGDVVALPAGTVHAIGAGLVVAEIQQNSDLTFRIYDYNRLGLDGKPRALHIKEALSAIRFDGPGDEIAGDMRADTVAPAERHETWAMLRERLVNGKYFDLERLTIRVPGPFEIEGRQGVPRVCMLLEGAVTIAGQRVTAGSTGLIPAACTDFTIHVVEAPAVWLFSRPH